LTPWASVQLSAQISKDIDVNPYCQRTYDAGGGPRRFKSLLLKDLGRFWE